jgi:hypothetical protein
MTRPELHALVDIVMDARERMNDLEIQIDDEVTLIDWQPLGMVHMYSSHYPTFSDFTQAVKEYIKTLEG